jgi:hypothetical protein
MAHRRVDAGGTIEIEQDPAEVTPALLKNPRRPIAPPASVNRRRRRAAEPTRTSRLPWVAAHGYSDNVLQRQRANHVSMVALALLPRHGQGHWPTKAQRRKKNPASHRGVLL